jgi:hypothetical protein
MLKESTRDPMDAPTATASAKRTAKPRRETPSVPFVPDLSPTQGVVSKIDFIDIIDDGLLSDDISMHREDLRGSNSTDDDDDAEPKIEPETVTMAEEPKQCPEEVAKSKTRGYGDQQ